MSSSTNLQVAKSFLMKIGSGAPPDDVADDVRRQFRNFQGRTGCGVTQFNPGLNVLRLAGQFGKAKEIEMLTPQYQNRPARNQAPSIPHLC